MAGHILQVLLVMVLVTLATAFALLVAALTHLRRRNRLHPSVTTSAPLSWLYSPAGSARLHRRLRLAVAMSGYRGRRRGRQTLTRIDGLAAALTREAVNLDRRLVRAALAPRRERQAQLRLLEPQVGRVEQVAARLAVLADEQGLDLGPSVGLDLLEEDVTCLEAAQREVDDLEALLHLPGDPFSPRRLDRPA
jgi:hypothetical protein